MKKFKVKEIVLGKNVIVMKDRKGKQQSFQLTKEMSDLEIQKAVMAGVDVSHFEETKDAKGQLKSFVTSSKNRERLLDSTSKKTTLVGLTSDAKQDTQKVSSVSEYELKFKIGQVFNDFEKATEVYEASVEELGKMDLKLLNKVTKLTGPLSAERIYKALHPA